MGEPVMESSITKNATEPTLSKYLTIAEKQFTALMEMDELDQQVFSSPLIAAEFEQTLGGALESAFGSSEGEDLNHLSLQRILYRINRLKFFWFDDLSNYKNERSKYLRRVRNRIESAWQRWE